MSSGAQASDSADGKLKSDKTALRTGDTSGEQHTWRSDEANDVTTGWMSSVCLDSNAPKVA